MNQSIDPTSCWDCRQVNIWAGERGVLVKPVTPAVEGKAKGWDTGSGGGGGRKTKAEKEMAWDYIIYWKRQSRRLWSGENIGPTAPVREKERGVWPRFNYDAHHAAALSGAFQFMANGGENSPRMLTVPSWTRINRANEWESSFVFLYCTLLTKIRRRNPISDVH